MSKNPDVLQNGSEMDIPDYAIDRIARCMLPMIQQYYESEEGRQELTKWQKKQNKTNKK